ncbi:glycoside hydrolase superfamily [Chaetomidium leptoderma]|uniref:beta-N-acetylhexosaminidase n=1 Tax=Chaetomidium leptoderma TaxID=669021 RepID=A0AAN6VL00_9PEZI|nr:glycoside hydrolase superfamily [Chaetomidium leptoderma]
MVSPLLSCLSLFLIALQPAAAIWPAPQSFTKGSSILYLHQNIQITYNGAPPVCPDEGLDAKQFLYQQIPYTYGYVPYKLTSKEVVQAGVSRTLAGIFDSKFVPWKLHKPGSKWEPDLSQGQKWLKTLQIVQTGEDQPSAFKPLAGEVDESYDLTVSAEGHVKLTAVSSIGVLHGLESFSQLFYQHSAGTFWYTPYAPVSIRDAPKFPHRGIMMDTARNFFPVPDILRTIDAMAWNKLNRLHVHVTDSQSWPLVIPALPEVSEKGAYHPTQTYSPADIDQIQKYGAARGVEVYFEIDMPGHIGVVSLSHPELIVAYNELPYWWWCAEPPCGAFKLNDTAVDAFLETLFDDLLPRLAPYAAYFHTGGDELNKNDSMLDEGIRSNASEVLQPLLQKFIDTQHARVRKAGLTPITWEEIPLEWNVTMGKDTVVQSWLGGDSIKTLTGMGHKVIDSNYNFWYLDCGRGQWLNWDNGPAFSTGFPFNDWCDPAKSWRLVYSHDPTANLTADEAKLVLGGEVALWSETIDATNFDTLAWPRASAAGEVLWSGRTDAQGQNRSQLDAAPRLNELRERMVLRGVRAAPIQMTPRVDSFVQPGYFTMGLIETLVDHVSARSVLLLGPGLLLAYIIVAVVVRPALQEMKLARMSGARAPRIQSVLPFGIDFVYGGVRASMTYQNLVFWRGMFSHIPSHNTIEGRIAGRRIIFTADPENIKAILATQFNDYGKGKPFHAEWSPFLGDSIFTTDGALWHNSRQLIRPQFIKDRVSDLHVFESHMQTLFRAIANGGALNGEAQPVDIEAGNGKPVDISDLFFRFTLDSATDFLLGHDVKSLSNPRQEFADAFAEVQRVQSIIARAGALNSIVPRGSFRKGMKVINNFINQYIERTLRLSPDELAGKAKSDAGYTFLHALAGYTRDRQVLRDQLIAVLLAGRDTTACTLSWTVYELARHPEALEKLRAEILAVVGPTRAPTYDDLKSMKYLQNVMNETLRLYPVVPFNVRLAIKNTTLPRGGGPDGLEPVKVLKDTPIAYSTLAMQRRADLYPPASATFAPVDVYSPDRWSSGWQPKPWQYIPFNGGPRICIGQQFALTEMGYVLTRLFQRYERIDNYMGEIDGGNPALRAEIVLQPGDGVKVGLWEAKRTVNGEK